MASISAQKCSIFLLNVILISVQITQSSMSLLETDDSNWPSHSPIWNSHFQSIKLDFSKNLTKVPKTTLNEIEEKSKQFPINFPIDSVKCSNLKVKISEEELETNINEAYPLIHETSLQLITSFMDKKKRFSGTQIEREIYQNLTLLQCIDRLLTRRSVSFIGPKDEYLLLDKTQGSGNWESIGKENETSPLLFKDYLSYEELKLSALISVSSPSNFLVNEINNESTGIVVGLIGARLEKKLVMEYREIIKSKEQNTHTYGYGRFFLPTIQGMFINYFGDASLTYQEMEWSNALNNSQRFLKISEDVYFDKLNYQKRIALTIDSLLIEANDRAAKTGKKAFVHVIGIGLKNWKITDEQDKIFMDTFGNRTKFLGKVLDSVSDLCFSEINHDSVLNHKSGEKIPIEGHPLGGIKIEIRNRSPFEKLVGENEGKLLIISYNWNSNALPGNEFWLNKTNNEDYDSIIATSTQITELHNPYINPKIQASNLKIVTLTGLVSLKDYIEAQEQKDKK